jgi:hypothetical protein
VIAIFAGPSLFGVDRSAFPELHFFPPAKAGDLLDVVAQGYRKIGLIDGVFEASPSVWHKEILFALSKGIAVFGAASMGALRAAECDAFGMIGLGKIYQSYREGSRVSDADVAVLHAPAELGYQPLTLAQADAEYALTDMIRKRRLSNDEAQHLLNISKEIYFKNRTWPSIIDSAELKNNSKDSLLEIVAENFTSQKTADVQLLLEAISKKSKFIDAVKPISKKEFNSTIFLKNLQDKANHD